jgi:hypothetical protein
MLGDNRLIRWIDRGYADGIATSNMALSLTLSVLGLIALSVESPTARWSLGLIAVGIFAVFGWRMAVSLRRAAERNRRDGR